MVWAKATGIDGWMNMSAHSSFGVFSDKQTSLSSFVLSCADARHATSFACCLLACVVVFAGLIAPCYTVLAVDSRQQHARYFF